LILICFLLIFTPVVPDLLLDGVFLIKIHLFQRKSSGNLRC